MQIPKLLPAHSKGISEDTAGCIEEMVKNPISAVQTITSDAGKFGMDMTKNIQGWGQIVAGLFVSLFNGFVDKGLSSLKGDYGQVKQSNVGGPEQLYEKAADGSSQPLSNFAKAPTNIIDLRGDFEKSLDASNQNITAINAMRTELIKVPTRLAYLDICLPGPDSIGLEKRMDDYYSQQTGWLQKKSAMGSDEKRNTYQEIILNMLDRDFTIAKAETQQDLIDDTKNIPGASAIRVAINRFNSRRPLWTSSLDSLTKTTDTLSQLRKINSDLKLSLAHLKAAEPAKLATVPVTILPFTPEEWDTLSPGERTTAYTWATTHAQPGTPLTTDTGKRDYVIKTVWDLWESPEQFFSDTKWSDTDASGKSVSANTFLDEKNAIRAEFNAVTDTVPTEWEISKNEQNVQMIKSENAQTDQLIHDCDKMRILVMGDPTTQTPPKWNGNAQEFLNDLKTNANTYFQSDEMKNSLTLPNILTTLISNKSWEDDRCRPDTPNMYEATYSSGMNYGEHYQGYSCYGNFGHLYGIESSEGCTAGCDFDKWIDSASNIYQKATHFTSYHRPLLAISNRWFHTRSKPLWYWMDNEGNKRQYSRR
jgi:hypothetical protein